MGFRMWSLSAMPAPPEPLGYGRDLVRADRGGEGGAVRTLPPDPGGAGASVPPVTSGGRRGLGALSGTGPRRSHRASDVLAQRVGLALDLVQAVLHHVADADHAAQPPVLLDHRHVAEPPAG